MILADLIPQTFFSNQAEWGLWLLVAGSVVVLAYGADRAVHAAVKLASSLGMSKVIIGATVVSLGTTAPEAMVSVTAAFQGKPGLALGNGVGSIICDTALIFGLCCCIVRLPKNRFVLSRHGWLQLGAGTLLAATLAILAVARGGLDGVIIPRAVGVLFVVLLVGYMILSVHWARQRPDTLTETAGEKIAANHHGVRLAANIALLAFGLALVAGGSNVLIGSVSRLCILYGVRESVLAVTVVAFGTSLPELVTAIASIAKGHPDLLIGNIIGADILNVLFVIGASATASQLAVPPEFYSLHVPVMMVSLVLLRLFIFIPGTRFRRWQGVLLLTLFASYYAMLLWR